MKAIGLVSGGLDSLLAIKLIADQKIEVLGLHFSHVFITPLFKSFKPNISEISRDLKIDIKITNIDKKILDIVQNPKYGYGSGVNPCIDCRILIFKEAKKYMRKSGAKFIVTGEVLRQRPMSQNAQSITLIEKKSGLEGLILRPLCAKLLPPSIPEIKGWIDRNKLLEHQGRSRKLQLSLAEKYGFESFSTPAGGCLLTDPIFTGRIKETLAYGEDKIHDIELLKLGRHFRIKNKIRCIVGRNEKENGMLIKIANKEDLLFEPVNAPGPTLLLSDFKKKGKKQYIEIASKLCVSYCKAKNDILIQYGTKTDNAVDWKNKIIIAAPQNRNKFSNEITAI